MLLAAAGSVSVGSHQFGKGGLPWGHSHPWPKQAQEARLASKGKQRKDRKPYSQHPAGETLLGKQSSLVVTSELGDHCWRWVHTHGGAPASCDLLSIIPTTMQGHRCGHQCKMPGIPGERSSSCPSPPLLLSEEMRREPSRGPPMGEGCSSLCLNTMRRASPHPQPVLGEDPTPQGLRHPALPSK